MVVFREDIGVELANEVAACKPKRAPKLPTAGELEARDVHMEKSIKK